MVNSRTKNTTKNILFSYLDAAITIIFQFISRTIIVHVFSMEYLGLSSLFSSILQVLNMAEMGFSVAIIYNMYKPIAENDDEEICKLLNYYKKVYSYISTAVLILGLGIVPFLTLLINESWPENINLYVLYMIYLANTVVSYAFFAYKTALLTALQRLDLVKIAYTLANIFQYVLQIISLLFLYNYYLFVGSMIVGTICKNILVSYFSKCKYPQYFCKGEISKDTKSAIIKQVKGMVICNISGITYTTFDSVILSTLLGLTSVAIYDNYISIFNGVMNFVILIRNAMQASIGNSIAIETKEKNYQDLFLWQFLFSVIAMWCSVCLICLYQPFMKLWMGGDKLLPMQDVILLCLWFFMNTVQHAYFLYMSGDGLWVEMKAPYILSTICNLLLNILLGELWGTTGIILATIVSTFLFGMVWQSSIIFKKYFERSVKKYWWCQAIYFLVSAITCLIAYFICFIISVDGIIGIMLYAIVCTCMTIIVVLLVYRNNNVYIEARQLLKKVLMSKTV